MKLTYADIDALSDQELDQLFAPPAPPALGERYEQLQELLPHIEKQLKHKGVTRFKLWKHYRGEHPDGYGYCRFNEHLRIYTGRTHPVMHLEHKAGDKLFIDFTGEKLSIADKDTGEVREVEVFVAILGCSQLTYVEAVYSQRKEDLIKACENALHYFGGVPTAIVPDNLKSAVTKSSKYEPTLNEAFADFSEHYSMAVLPTRAYRPRDKALVEGAVKLIYRSIFTVVNQAVHTSLANLNAAIKEAGLSIPYNFIVDNALSKEKTVELATELLQLKEPPDAFFTVSDHQSLGVLQAAESFRIKVPEQLGIFGFANEAFTEMIRPSLSSVDPCTGKHKLKEYLLPPTGTSTTGTAKQAGKSSPIRQCCRSNELINHRNV